LDGLALVASRLVAIVGPTGSGKSALGLDLAGERGGEIVSCDSLQVYRGLDVGSAKSSAAERARVRHHLVDIRDPDEDFSAADYARLARAAIEDVRDRGRLPILVGGTGLYLRALLVGLFEGPSRDVDLRRRLESMADRYGDARLHRLLRRVDPEAAARIHVHDRLRVVRALEVFRATGRPLSAQRQEGLSPLAGFDTLIVGLDLPRPELRARMEQRTRAMMDGGLVEEVRGLIARGYSPDLRPLHAIGYRQALDVMSGKLSIEAALGAIVTDSMQYAKRQRTWFRHQARVRWFDSTEGARHAVRAWLEAPAS
jgi:tRNA dimethylallyltransferase